MHLVKGKGGRDGTRSACVERCRGLMAATWELVILIYKSPNLYVCLKYVFV